jgi:hypothetical protein
MPIAVRVSRVTQSDRAGLALVYRVTVALSAAGYTTGVLRTSLQRHSRFLSVLLAPGLAIAIAACGSAAKPTGTTSSNLTSRLAFAKCMRSHGVSNFPDGPNIPVAAEQSPAFQTAVTACRKLLPGGGPHGGISESTKLSLLHHAQCMRVHGVPSYPDPNIPSHGPYDFGPPRGINTDTPAFKHAAAACGSG